MKAAVFREVGKLLSIEEWPDPRPARGQVVLKVARCGVCGSDLHFTEGHGRTLPAGSTFGHEFSGEVVELGAGVTKLRLGDYVTAQPMMGCGTCGPCQKGEPYWCVGEKPPGQASGYAEYTLSSEGSAVKLPADVSLQDAALTEPLACGLHGVHRAELKAGDRVLVMGAGPIGLGAAFWAKKAGAAKVLVIARSERRREIALAVGADHFLAPKTDVAAEVAEALGGPPDIVFECAGMPGAIAQAIDCVRPRGKVVSLGFCTVPDSFVPATALAKEVDLRFAIVYNTADFETCLEALGSGAVGPRAMITDVVSLSQFPAAFEALRTAPGQCKVMLDPWAP